jgi:uncharacterized protein
MSSADACASVFWKHQQALNDKIPGKDNRMNAIIESRRPELLELCRRYRVRRLEVFGSACRDDFDPGESDLDFLVEFLPLRSGEYADAYFGLLEGLTQLFKRPIDLVMPTAIQNPYLLESINQSRSTLYAA